MTSKSFISFWLSQRLSQEHREDYTSSNTIIIIEIIIMIIIFHQIYRQQPTEGLTFSTVIRPNLRVVLKICKVI